MVVKRKSSAGWPGLAGEAVGDELLCGDAGEYVLERKAYLGAPEQAEQTAATIDVVVREVGRYLVLARYEAV